MVQSVQVLPSAVGVPKPNEIFEMAPKEENANAFKKKNRKIDRRGSSMIHIANGIL